MFEPTVALSTSVNWLLTYAIHSTILICACWLVCHLVPGVSDRVRDFLWKLALTGALVTASVQVGAGIRPELGAFEVDTGTSVATVQPTTTEPVEAGVRRHTIVTDAGSFTMELAHHEGSRTTAAAAPVEPPMWPWVLVGLWGLGATMSLLRIFVGQRRLRRQLKDRKEVLDDPVLEAFLTLCRDAKIGRKVRLTSSSAIDTPIALGKSEICLPERALGSLTPRQVLAVLAHELGHLQRRDPRWMKIAGTIEAVFFFQPLNRLARRQMQAVSEYLCDDWAVRHPGTGEHLATSLATVASWKGGIDATPLGPAVLRRGRPFVKRVNKLLDRKRDRSPSEGGAARYGAVLGILGAMVWLAPGVVSARPEPVQKKIARAEPEPVEPEPVEEIAAEVVEEEVVEREEVIIIERERCGHRCGHGHLHGHVRSESWPFGSGLHFWGWPGIEADPDFDFDFRIHIGTPEVHIDIDDHWSDHGRHDRFHERMDRARERHERDVERAQRRHERAREKAERRFERDMRRLERELDDADDLVEHILLHELFD